jgi:hypothetical protein
LKRILTCLVILFIVSPATLAQTRRRTSRPAPATTAKKSVAVQAGATRVADQLKVLTRFIYLLVVLENGIEAADAAARRNYASPAVLDQTQKSKATVRTSIANVRQGLDQLELDFRSNSELNRYYIPLAGVASGAAKAEEQAAANQFDQAGRTLLDVVNRLTDVLLEMSK